MRRFGRMDGAPAIEEKVALGITGLAQTAKMFGAVNVLLFKSARAHSQVSRGTFEILFGQINETVLFAAIRATWLALKSEAIHTY